MALLVGGCEPKIETGACEWTNLDDGPDKGVATCMSNLPATACEPGGDMIRKGATLTHTVGATCEARGYKSCPGSHGMYKTCPTK